MLILIHPSGGFFVYRADSSGGCLLLTLIGWAKREGDAEAAAEAARGEG